MSEDLVHPLDVRLMNATAVFLGLAALLVVMAQGSRWLATLPMFGVHRIIVEGDTERQNAITLRANVANRFTGSFLLVDLANLRSAFEAMPWVRRAVVKREFPGLLRVALEEHKAGAVWGGESESRMVNTYGEVFEANGGEAEFESLPRLMGPDQQAAMVLTMYKKLTDRLDAKEVEIEMLELTPRHSWRLRLDSGTSMELGRGATDEVLARFDQFLQTYDRILSSYGKSQWERIESVDLRNGQGYAIRMRGVTTVAQVTGQKN